MTSNNPIDKDQLVSSIVKELSVSSLTESQSEEVEQFFSEADTDNVSKI